MLKQIIGQKPEGDVSGHFHDSAAMERVPATAPIPSPTISSSMSGKNILSSDVEIKGSIKFSNDLIIDGKIDGEVTSDGNLTVGENAECMGEIKTRSVIIFGKVQGNVTVQERCELKSNAILEGDITAGTLAIEEGATFMGSSAVGKRRPPEGGQGSERPAIAGLKNAPAKAS